MLILLYFIVFCIITFLCWNERWPVFLTLFLILQSLKYNLTDFRRIIEKGQWEKKRTRTRTPLKSNEWSLPTTTEEKGVSFDQTFFSLKSLLFLFFSFWKHTFLIKKIISENKRKKKHSQQQYSTTL